MLVFFSLLLSLSLGLSSSLHANRSLSPFVDIVITVKTDIKFVRSCVHSLLRHAPDPKVLQQRVVFVDDGSPSSTLAYELELCRSSPGVFFCTETSGLEKGYTWAIEKGIHFVSQQGGVESDSVVLLNLDTIVTNGWLISMHKMLMSKYDTMIVGPLSNAATWQSVPTLDISDNALPLGLNPDLISREIHRYTGKGTMPGVPMKVINGFCFMFKREVLKSVTGFDTKNFGQGYGEEVDFCLRAHKKGFHAKIDPNSYVFHTKTASFQSDEKKELNIRANTILNSKYKNLLHDFKTERKFARKKLLGVAKHVDSLYQQYSRRIHSFAKSSLLFVIPATVRVKDLLDILRLVFYLRAHKLEARVETIDWNLGHIPLSELLAIHFPDLPLTDQIAVMNVRWKDLQPKSESFNPEPYTARALHLKADIVVATSVNSILAVDRICEVNLLSQPSLLLLESSLAHPARDKNGKIASSASNRNSFPVFRVPNVSLSLPWHLPKSTNALSAALEEVVRTHSAKLEEDRKPFVASIIPPHIAYEVYYISPHDLKHKLGKHFATSKKYSILIDASSEKWNFFDLYKHLIVAMKKLMDSFKQVEVTVLLSEHDRNAKLQNRFIGLSSGFQYVTSNFSRPLSDLASLYRATDLFIDISTGSNRLQEQLLLEVMACGSVVAVPQFSLSQPSICSKQGAVDDSSDLLCLSLEMAHAEHMFKAISAVVVNASLQKSLVLRGIEVSREYPLEEAALEFLEQVSRSSSSNFFGLNSSEVVSLTFAMLIVSVAIIGMAYLRPAASIRKK